MLHAHIRSFVPTVTGRFGLAQGHGLGLTGNPLVPPRHVNQNTKRAEGSPDVTSGCAESEQRRSAPLSSSSSADPLLSQQKWVCWRHCAAAANETKRPVRVHSPDVKVRGQGWQRVQFRRKGIG